MIAEKIKKLRESQGLTQTQLAKILHVTRSSVNAWEQGISIPGTQLILDLAEVFSVSTDYILGAKTTAVVNVEGLSEDEVALISRLITILKNKSSFIPNSCD